MSIARHPLAREDRSDRIARDARLSGDRADPFSLPMQDLYLHLKLLLQHANIVQ